MDELVAAAEAEGEVTWYNSSAIAGRVTEAFEDLYNIRVTVVQAPATELFTRFEAEAAAGSSVADVFTNTPCNDVDDLITQGYLRAVTSDDVSNFDDFPDEFLRGEHKSPAFHVLVWSMGINTARVSADEIPSDWEDLADERWEGRIVLADPMASEAQQDLWNQLSSESGIELLEAIGANTVSRASSVTPAIEALAAGEGDVMVPAAPGPIANAIDNGAPVENVLMDRTVGMELCTTMATEPIHPNAARLFMNFLLSEEANVDVINALPGEYSPFRPDEIPSGYLEPGSVTQEQVEEVDRALGF